MAAPQLELARALVAEDKGVLAAGESTGTVTRRLDAVDLESTRAQPWELSNRAFYRRAQLVHAARLGEYSEEVAA